MGFKDKIQEAKEKIAGEEDHEDGSFEDIREEVGAEPPAEDELDVPGPDEERENELRQEFEELESGDREESADVSQPVPDTDSDSKENELAQELQELEKHVSGMETSEESESRLQELEERLQKLETEVLSSESEELSRIGDLEERLRNLEVEDEKEKNDIEELEERIEDFRTDLESLDAPQLLDDRLTELEDTVTDADNMIEFLVDNGLAEELEIDVEDPSDRIESVEEELRRLKSQVEDDSSDDISSEVETLSETVEGLRDDLSDLRSRVDSMEDDDGSEEVEELWEAMDEEVSMLERRIEDNRQKNEQLLDQMVELTELVKDGLR